MAASKRAEQRTADQLEGMQSKAAGNHEDTSIEELRGPEDKATDTGLQEAATARTDIQHTQEAAEGSPQGQEQPSTGTAALSS